MQRRRAPCEGGSFPGGRLRVCQLRTLKETGLHRFRGSWDHVGRSATATPISGGSGSTCHPRQRRRCQHLVASCRCPNAPSPSPPATASCVGVGERCHPRQRRRWQHLVASFHCPTSPSPSPPATACCVGVGERLLSSCTHQRTPQRRQAGDSRNQLQLPVPPSLPSSC